MRVIHAVMGALIGVVLVACSADETSQEGTIFSDGGAQAGSGGAPGGGSPNAGGFAGNVGGAGTGAAGASGSGGSMVASNSLLAVCTRYVEAECQRLYDCGQLQDPSECAGTVQLCPDYMFASGSTRTVDNTIACTEAWKTFSCSDLAVDRVPSCATNGIKQPGEKCLYSMQCASGYCTGQTNPCGTCASLAAPGGACSIPDVYCPDGQTCNLGKCEDNPPATAATRTPAAAGDPCTRSSICPTGSFCNLDTSSRTDGHCSTLPAAGAPCGNDAWGPKVCGSGLYCPDGTTCAPLPALGQPCTTACQADGYCATGSCKPRLDVGGLCFVDSHDAQSSCTAGLQCFCNDYQCEAGTCYEPRVEGAACGDARGHCISGATCTNGVCVSADPMARFAALCGP